MRKYYITRKSAVTTVSLKVVNSTNYEISDAEIVLDGVFSVPDEAMKAVNKVWKDEVVKPVSVTNLACKVNTLAMTAKNWFENAEVIEEQDVSVEEASQFGKRTKKPVVDAQ
jgi:hypothetical protein